MSERPEGRLTLAECAELDALFLLGPDLAAGKSDRLCDLLNRAVLYGRDDVVERPFAGFE